MNIFDLEKIRQLIDWKKKKTIAFIGRGKEADKYKYNSNVVVICINDSVEFYPEANFTAIVESHLSKQISLVINKIDNVILIRKKHFVPMDLIVGCTPSLIISYCLNYLPIERIYLQGFSMDGVIHNVDMSVLEKQKNIFIESCKIASEKGIDKGLEYYLNMINYSIGVVNYFPYDWIKQENGFKECFEIAKSKNIDMGFVTYCSKMSGYKRMEPLEKDIVKN